MNAKTVHANFCLPKKHQIRSGCTLHAPSPPQKKRACRRLIKVTQRYMLTIVGPGMFDLDIFKWMVGEESGERRLICSASPTPLPFLLTVAHPFGTYFFL